MQHFGKSALRTAKNYTKGYSDVQAKVRDATSNDPWGPSGTQMNEIAQMTYNQNDFIEVMEMLDKRLNDKGKNWRHVFKSLTVLDYCLHAGSENVVIYFRDNMYVIKTLREFQYVDEEGKDQGANVRQKAKDITNLLQDESRLRDERRSRAHMRDRLIEGRSSRSTDDLGTDENTGRRGSRSLSRRGENGQSRSQKDKDKNKSKDGDDELRRAIEESKRLASKAENNEERDLAEAIRLSEEDEAKRNKAIEDSNANSLFDDQNQKPSTSSNPFSFVDPSQTGQPSQNAFNLQPQFTQASLQPQFTSFNPYLQQAQQEALQAEYQRQQQEWQQQLQQQQLHLQQLQQQQQQAQDQWLRQQQVLLQQQQQQKQQELLEQQRLLEQQKQQQLLEQQLLIAQPTSFGSNNPFFSSSPVPPSILAQPTTNSTFQLQRPIEFNLQGTFAGQQTSTPTPILSDSFSPTPSSRTTSPPSSQAQIQAPFQSTAPRRNPVDQEHAALANLLANRDDDGLDTFGNIGTLRYGQTNAGRLAAQKTGAVSTHNPFAQQFQQPQQNADRLFDI